MGTCFGFELIVADWDVTAEEGYVEDGRARVGNVSVYSASLMLMFKCILAFKTITPMVIRCGACRTSVACFQVLQAVPYALELRYGSELQEGLARVLDGGDCENRMLA